MDVRRICVLEHTIHDRTIWRELAHRIGVRSVSSQQSSLTTATTEIDFSLRTTSAWLGHPFRSAKSVKAFGFTPNPIEIACPNIFEPQIRNCRRSSRAGEHVADWIYGEISLAPAVKTRFWASLIVIGQHIKDVDLACE